MKTLALVLALCAGTVQAESLCKLDDADEGRAVIAGVFEQSGGISVESVTLSLTQPIEDTSHVVIDPDGSLTWARTDAWLGRGVPLSSGGVVHDVDAVDDLLDTVEAGWIADALSDTPCGPEDLPQWTATFQAGEVVDGQAEMAGDVTVIAYFSDRMLILSEVELRGDWGIAFLTTAALLTRSEDG